MPCHHNTTYHWTRSACQIDEGNDVSLSGRDAPLSSQAWGGGSEAGGWSSVAMRSGHAWSPSLQSDAARLASHKLWDWALLGAAPQTRYRLQRRLPLHMTQLVTGAILLCQAFTGEQFTSSPNSTWTWWCFVNPLARNVFFATGGPQTKNGSWNHSQWVTVCVCVFLCRKSMKQ